jgi:hypothetical protein
MSTKKNHLSWEVIYHCGGALSEEQSMLLCGPFILRKPWPVLRWSEDLVQTWHQGDGAVPTHLHILPKFKGIVRNKLRWVKKWYQVKGLPLTLNPGYFIFKFKGTPFLKFNITFFSF